MRSAAVVALVLLLPNAASAREKDTGKLLLTVNVNAHCEAAGESTDVSQDRVGILEVPAGDVHVVCHADGYDDASQPASVGPGGSALVKVELLRSDRPRAGQSRREPKSGLEFVYLPGGSFHYGCEPADKNCLANEKPGQTFAAPPIWMGKTDVTADAYTKCVSAGACTTPGTGGHCTWGVAGREQHPINCVDWDQAKRFCTWIGGKLPTAEEWEYAAKSGESRVYPWGDTSLTGKRANFCDKACKKENKDWKAIFTEDDGWAETSPVGTYPGGASKYGLVDMSGNVWQWTASQFSATTKELRGGAWDVPSARMLRASYRSSGAPDGFGRSVGFRCEL